MTDQKATLADDFLAEIENGIRILRTVPPLDKERQERIDQWARLAVEVRKYIAQKREKA